jgi:hypothetical protein
LTRRGRAGIVRTLEEMTMDFILTAVGFPLALFAGMFGLDIIAALFFGMKPYRRN